MQIQQRFTHPARPNSYANTDGRPTWSPDGSKVAAELGRDLVVVDRESHTVENKLGAEGKWSKGPDFSPDGSKVIFSTFDKHRDYKLSSWGIYKSNPDGTERELVSVDGWEPEFNPQGDKVAFHLIKSRARDRIGVMNSDGSDLKPVTKGGYFQSDLSWSPGGHQIAYDTVFAATYQLRITDITGTKDRELTDGENGLFQDRNPEWSPDGKSIMFERHDKHFPSNELWVVNPNTRKSKQLLGMNGYALDAAWSPDGQKIAFTADRDGGRDLDIYVMDADGKNIQQISDLPGHEHAPSWSPDGRAIAFNRFDSEAPREQQNDFHVAALKDDGSKEEIKSLIYNETQ